MTTYENSFSDENFISFKIGSIEWEDDAMGVGDTSIEFEYSAPNVSVDSAGRFAVHDIIGGTTVRQKVGEEPVEVDINGVCREETARELDSLRNAKYGAIFSKRLVGGSMAVQFASISTSPLEDGGAVAISDEDGSFLYEFDIAAVEVSVPGNPPSPGALPDDTGGEGEFVGEYE